MHCPDCGQQQINDEIRFCSRCGFPLAVVSQVVANRGILPELNEPGKKKKFLTRKVGIFFGITWMLFFILVVTVFLEGIKAPGELVSIAAVFGIFSGILIIMASALFLGRDDGRYDDDRYQGGRPNELRNYSPNALPPQQTVPVQNYSAPKNRWETNDLVQPSVTEGTTKLLDKNNGE
jgi:hypothetical protein